MTNLKQKLRQKYRAVRDSFGEEFIKKASKAACKNLINTKEFSDADTVLLYYPINNELSPLKILEIAIQSGKTVAFPVCQKEDRTLIFRKVTSLSQLRVASFGIFEPSEECSIVTPNERTLCIVPALALGRSGERLGYGGGYYDKFLATFGGTSAGFIYSELAGIDLPQENFDVSLNMIITDREVHNFA